MCRTGSIPPGGHDATHTHGHGQAKHPRPPLLPTPQLQHLSLRHLSSKYLSPRPAVVRHVLATIPGGRPKAAEIVPTLRPYREVAPPPQRYRESVPWRQRCWEVVPRDHVWRWSQGKATAIPGERPESGMMPGRCRKFIPRPRRDGRSPRRRDHIGRWHQGHNDAGRSSGCRPSRKAAAILGRR